MPVIDDENALFLFQLRKARIEFVAILLLKISTDERDDGVVVQITEFGSVYQDWNDFLLFEQVAVQRFGKRGTSRRRCSVDAQLGCIYDVAKNLRASYGLVRFPRNIRNP